MTFTARHYTEVARIIQRAREDLRDEIAIGTATHAVASSYVGNIQSDLCRMFCADNPRFDGTRFDMACEPKGASRG